MEIACDVGFNQRQRSSQHVDLRIQATHSAISGKKDDLKIFEEHFFHIFSVYVCNVQGEGPTLMLWGVSLNHGDFCRG